MVCCFHHKTILLLQGLYTVIPHSHANRGYCVASTVFSWIVCSDFPHFPHELYLPDLQPGSQWHIPIGHFQTCLLSWLVDVSLSPSITFSFLVLNTMLAAQIPLLLVFQLTQTLQHSNISTVSPGMLALSHWHVFVDAEMFSFSGTIKLRLKVHQIIVTANHLSTALQKEKERANWLLKSFSILGDSHGEQKVGSKFILGPVKTEVVPFTFLGWLNSIDPD